MPGPSSSTRISTNGPEVRAAHGHRPPSGENETALSRRFVSTCPSRPSSPTTK